MAIDSTLFAASIPAGTYAIGDTVPLSIIRGPAVVRDGYGEARLKRMFTVQNGAVVGHLVLKNSNWVDSMANIVSGSGATILANNSNCIQSGHDSPLQRNSGWEATFVFDDAITTTADVDVFALIDIDYPSVQAVANPKQARGTPATNNRIDSITTTAAGSGTALVWTTLNVDILKAGYRYLLASATFRNQSCPIGFLSISGAAGQNGLERIIPCVPNSLAALRYDLDYSTPLVKGPFNLNYAAMASGSATVSAILELDWVKG